ncbi:MAG: AAA family ATPase, partial [Methylomicrobium sp.]|nr:AAA family ATPase [Methylomicrobium sp.]
MASGALLRQLIKSGSEGDSDSFRRVSEKIIQEERDKQHHLLANDLEKILYGRRSSSEQAKRFVFSKLPEDKERGLALLQIKDPLRRIDDVVLSDENRSLLDEILEEHHRVEILKSHGLFPSDRLLFCGPPGCGKTLSAEIVAAELSLPLAIVRIDSVVSSYLGETAANLRKVF